MKKNKIKLIFGIGLLTLSGTITSITTSCNSTIAAINNVSIVHGPEYGGIDLPKSIEKEFYSKFSLGDSLNLDFSYGIYVKDVPFYSFYTAKINSIACVAYPNYPISLARCTGTDLYTDLNLNEECTVNISLNKKQKYAMKLNI